MDTERKTHGIISDIMTIRDVADYLRLSEATIYQMARAGRIPALRMGRIWRFKKENIDHWIENATEKSKDPVNL